MKDGRTHLAYKAEHAVDLETGAVVAVTVAAGDAGDPETILETLPQAGEHIAEVACATNTKKWANGYRRKARGKRSPTRDITATTRCRRWRKRKCERISQNRIVDASLARQVGSTAGGVWQPAADLRGAGQGIVGRGELLERSFAHAYETGGCGECSCEGEKMFSSEG